MYKEYDLVKLLSDIPEKNIYAGMIGTIVMIYNESNLPIAYEVEFCDKNGNTISLVTLKEKDIQLI